MFASAHLTSGLALAFALDLHGWPFAAVVLASVFTDWDYGFQLLTGRNHRTFLSHSPPIVALVLVMLAFFEPLAWFVLLGAMLHFSLDIWEYGLRLNPMKADVIGFRLMPGIEDMPFRTYLRTYFQDRRFLAAELAFGGAAVGLGAWRLLPLA